MAENTGTKGGQYGNTNAEKWTEDIALRLGQDLIAWQKKDVENIFYEEFLVSDNDLHPNIISYLCQKFDSFRELIEKAQKIQERKLSKYGVLGNFNPAMTKFMMINNHGYKSDKTEQDITSKGDKISINIMSPNSKADTEDTE